ncbi:hypothetical protein PG303_07165 [Riemerella anatipestifer]|uniref:Integrase catalytic domain-containing protein n=1 Tax=Riemerella anatipestifer TaxID=34085 RepID=A0AAP6HHI6_RIEAN|nr:hypothetical protein [Riemerella anatipestifer]
MNTATPYEYHDGKLGVKVLWLISDERGKKKKHPQSLSLISYNALYKRMNSKTCTEKDLRRASLGFDALVQFDSLCVEWRDALTMKFPKPKEQAQKSFFTKHYEADRQAFDFFCAHRFGENDERKLEPEVIELYTYNASVLNAVITCKTNRKAYIKALGASVGVTIWESLSKDVNSFNEVPHDLPTTPDSLRYKVNKYLKEGYESIISKKYGKRNRAKIKKSEQFILIEELLKKHQNMNNEQIADHYNTVAKAIGWEPITGSTIANIRKELGLYTYAGQRGLVSFEHKKAMQVKRSRPSLPMLYWTVDGWDAELLYQAETINKKGQKVKTYHNRLTMVLVLDPFNDYPVGYAIGEAENPALIREAIANAVNHTKKLFGKRYKPYQFQADNYQKKHLKETYEAIAKHFTPARVKNSKAKVIEPFFNHFNKKHFQKEMVLNWSGHNVNAKRDNQPNDEYLNKVRHQFPDELGARMQIINAIEKERKEKVQAYLEHWNELPEDDRILFKTNEFLRVFGQTTGYTNKLQGSGITATINGEEYYFDSFDQNFRKYAYVDWCLYFDPSDMSEVLAVNAESHHGRLVKVIDTIEFMLEEKYIQPMALYDRKEGDAAELQKVFDFNANLKEDIIERGGRNREVLQELFIQNPKLEVLQKMLITDSNGQHKDQKRAERLQEPKARPLKQIEKFDDYEIIDDVATDY